MLGTIAVVLGGFAFLVLRSYRSARSEPFRPEGKLRWSDEPPA
jgi:hypothetical protein